MNKQAYAASGIAKLKQRMGRGLSSMGTVAADGPNPSSISHLANASTQPSRQPVKRSATTTSSALSREGFAQQAKTELRNHNQSVASSGLSKDKTGNLQKKPNFKKKTKLSSLMSGYTDPAEDEVEAPVDNQETEGFKPGNAESEKEEGGGKPQHYGATASFAIKETFDKIKAKLESAERRMNQYGFGGAGQQEASKQVNEFRGAEDGIAEEDQEAEDYGDDEYEVAGFKKPLSGRSSRSGKGGKSTTAKARCGVHKSISNQDDIVRTGDRSSMTNSKKALFDKTPSQVNIEMCDNDSPNEEFLLDDSDLLLQQTPSAFGGSNRSKKTRMGSTDAQGNRLSNMPGEERPSLTSVTPYDDNPSQLIKKVEQIVSKAQSAKQRSNNKDKEAKSFANNLEKLAYQQEELMQSKAVLKNDGQQLERKNFVRINQNKMAKYKPALRGAAFSNKIMAKKSNVMKYRNRQQQKIMAERAANSVNAYGGLGAHGLDFGDEAGPGSGAAGEQGKKEREASFSGSAMHCAPKVVTEFSEDGSDEQIEDQDAENIQVQVDHDDSAEFEVQDNDQGYVDILNKKFGHAEFLEGQLKAVKIILEQKKNALVVLATGGGKSLCYQYISQFLPGLVLVVTPLISLMTDQLQKLPPFIRGAALNSQQTYQMKQAVIKAVHDKQIKVLFITPERLFMEDLSKFGRPISMVCVDEIHCSSEWSHNFRPAYLVLHEMIREKLGKDTRVIGLTATATRAAQQQICGIFDIKYPNHIVTQTDLSRLNLQLSITRDQEKTRALLTLLRSPSFKGLSSILIFATQRRTTDQIAQLLNQNGMKAASYHAGKTDSARSYIQKEFIEDRTRILCCTIAFSMGIDKSDIQSVIHYDLPRSIENYVQEIGRAGRDGKLARCHMFLNNQDFYQLRRISLSDLLDNQSALRLTNMIVLEAKKQLYKHINNLTEVKETKKRKRKDAALDEDQCYEQVIEEFQFESEISELYQETEEDEGVAALNFINLAQTQQFNGERLYISLDVKDLLNALDLKKEVVLTMMNQLEKLDPTKSFFRVDSVLPASIQMRFHTKSLDELANSGSEQILARTEGITRSKLYKVFKAIATNRQGIYRCSLVQLAQKLDIKPYSVPKILYALQHDGKDDIAYDMDQESFILEVSRIPHQSHVFELSQDMLVETRRIEKNLVSKLNCMYFAARKVSLPNVDYMMRKETELEEQEKESSQQMYIDFSKRLNDLINVYFRAEKNEDMEIKIAGDAQERALMMPLLYIDDSEETRTQVANDMTSVVDQYHRAEKDDTILNPSMRMKPLDVVKVLMGIMSTRESVKRFQYDGKNWAKLHEYDYEQLMTLAEDVVSRHYVDAIANATAALEAHKQGKLEALQAKKRKLN